jgi:phospholipid/cholesterol/gamma-HCH transport system ATP-binding protein
MEGDRQFMPEARPDTADRTAAASGLQPPVVLEARDLSLAFGGNRVLNEISFRVREGEALGILGASGVGKSTILKLILRLLVPDGGQILIDGEDINQLTFEEVLKVRQKMGMVFQASALFDSLSVYENVAFPLREHTQLREEEVAARVQQALVMVDLSMDELGARLPAELSGGQKKRVGIARAIVHEPKILLFDEPTTGLDPVTARMIVALMKRLEDELEVTAVVVSHDVRAVLEVSTDIAMLKDGEIIFYGTPEEIMASTNRDVREFVD